MAILKCKMCGGDLQINEGMTVCECEYCGTRQTVPIIDDEKKIKLFERANRLRSNCEFDKAAGVYENIVADYSEEAEGYWGLLLCRYGIEYVDDPITGKKIPTCHRSSFDSIMDDEDFELVMENSDSISRMVYREEAKYIEEIRKGIIEVSGKEEPYDIFICYKEKDEDGERTLDSVLAQDVYDELTNKGYRVFFSRISLEDKLGVEYEPYIFAALNSAKIMLAFGTSYDHYNAVWVKNEWSRYLKLMAKDKTKHLIPCFKNVDAYDIPKEFAKLQSQDMGKIGAIQDLMRGIDKLISTEPKVEKSAAHDNIVYNPMGANSNAILKRGFMALEDGEWSKATNSFEQVLNINAEEGQAYWGELLAEYKCSSSSLLSKKLFEQLIGNIEEVSLQLEIPDKYPEYSSKYFFMQVFSQEKIQDLIYHKFMYKSKVASVEDIIQLNKSNAILAENRLYKRALQYASDELKSDINNVIPMTDNLLREILRQVKEEEAEYIKEATERADTYYAKLDNALNDANKVAIRNAESNEAAFQAEHTKWEEEQSTFEERHYKWQQQMADYRTVYNKWNKEKTEYYAKKKGIEYELKKLEENKHLIDPDGFRAESKLNKVNKDIIKLKNELSNLRLPESAPEQPSKPVLRAEPILSFEDKIGKEEVLQVFNASWTN